MHVHRTDFFNHSSAPDLVLSWPRESDEDRYVFLRFTDDLEYFADGMRRLPKEDPIVFGLTAITAEEKERNVVRSVARSSRSLVTDPMGIETFIDREERAPVLSLLSNAVARGGVGLLDATESQRAAAVVADGFSGARNLFTGPTKEATDLLGDILSTRYAGRMNRFLQAVWVGSGGAVESFPGPASVADELSAEALEFLLNFPEVDDLDFWYGIGTHLSVDQLSKLTVREPLSKPSARGPCKCGEVVGSRLCRRVGAGAARRCPRSQMDDRPWSACAEGR
jgi:hypothetical protein